LLASGELPEQIPADKVMRKADLLEASENDKSKL